MIFQASSNTSAVHDPYSQQWLGVPFTNPVTGERIEVIEIAEGTEGRCLRGRLTLRPGASGPPRHVHPRLDEYFEIVSNRLRLDHGGELVVLGEGETAKVPSGTPHRFDNPFPEPVVFYGDARPGSRLIHALSTLFGLAHDGKVRSDGTPKSPLQAMVFAREMRDVLYLASPPLIVQRVLWTLLAPVARRRGYRAVYDRYLRPGFWHRLERSVPAAPGTR